MSVDLGAPVPLGEASDSGLDVLGRLQPWRDAGVLTAADTHIAATLARVCGLVDGPDAFAVVLAAGLAARAPRHGHVCLDLATVRDSLPAELEGDSGADGVELVDALPWPSDVDGWQAVVAASPLVTSRPAPLVVNGPLVYLERYLVYERQVATELLRRAAEGPSASTLGAERRAALLELLLPGVASAGQRAAAEAGSERSLAVVVGGPGTGKTRTVAALLALLLDAETTAGGPPRRVALAAPTGKAAARMGESIVELSEHVRRSGLPDAAGLADRMAAAEASTIHRLLGSRGPGGGFRHDAARPLDHDVVIVDETSMVSLPLMARLLAAVAPDARVVLVGDPGQLASVEAGSVLGDIAGPALDAAAESRPVPAGPLASCVSVLTESYRFPRSSSVGRFAAAVRRGDADVAIAVLQDPPPAPTGADIGTDTVTAATAETPEGAAVSGAVTLAWHPTGGESAAGADAIRAAAEPASRATVEWARAGDAAAALGALGRVRVLCAHRRGPYGVARWNWQFEQWLGEADVVTRGFYAGRPVLVTANDRANGLFNGDLGVVVVPPADPGEALAGAPADGPGRLVRVAFPVSAGVRLVAPARLESVETVHAMTIHKSQGSEFDEVIVVLPPAESRLATRELLYTAVTRARRRVTIVGGEKALRAAIGRRVVRASGLARRLWPAD